MSLFVVTRELLQNDYSQPISCSENRIGVACKRTLSEDENDSVWAQERLMKHPLAFLRYNVHTLKKCLSCSLNQFIIIKKYEPKVSDLYLSLLAIKAG